MLAKDRLTITEETVCIHLVSSHRYLFDELNAQEFPKFPVPAKLSMERTQKPLNPFSFWMERMLKKVRAKATPRK